MTRRIASIIFSLIMLAGPASAGTWSTNGFGYKPHLTAEGTTNNANTALSQDRIDAGLGASPYYGGALTLAGAVSNIGSASTQLTLPVGTWSISADLVIPANVSLRVMKGGVITIPTGKTLTINGPFDAGLYQVFSCTGTGKAVFGTGTVKEVHPEWWGAAGNGTTDDAAALNAALLAYTKINLTKGKVFAFGSQLDVTLANTHIYGGGKLLQITNATPFNGLWVTANGVTIEDLTITGIGIGSVTSFPAQWGGGVCFYSVSNGTVRNCIINNWGTTAAGGSGSGIYFVRGSSYCSAINNRIDGCLYGGAEDDNGHTDLDPHLSIGNQWIGNIITGSLANGLAIDYQSSAATTNMSYGFNISSNTISDSALMGGGFGVGLSLVACRGGGVISNNLSYGNAGAGFELKANTGNVVMDGNYAYNNGSHGVLIYTGVGYVISPAYVNVSNLLTSGNGGDGINIDTAYDVSVIALVSNTNGRYGYYAHHLVGGSLATSIISLNQNEGVYFSSCNDWTVQGGRITANGQATANTYAGLRGVKDDYSNQNITISGVDFSAITYPTQTQKYAVKLDTDVGATSCIVRNCNMVDALTAPYVNDFLGAIFENNLPNSQIILYGTGTIDTDLSLGPWVFVDAEANAALTINAPTNAGYRQRIIYEIKKGANALTITWGAGFQAGTTSVNANKQALIEFEYDASVFRQIGTPIETTP